MKHRLVLTLAAVAVLVSFVGGFAAGRSESRDIVKEGQQLILDLRQAALDGYMHEGFITGRDFPARTTALSADAWDMAMSSRETWFKQEMESSYYYYMTGMLHAFATEAIFMAARTGSTEYLDDANRYYSMANLYAEIWKSKKKQEDDRMAPYAK